MNHFVYNLLSAISYNISLKSFIIAKKWNSIGLLSDVVAVFSSPTFKTLSAENKQIIYDKINNLRELNINKIEKKKWLNICKEQLEGFNFPKEDKEVLKRSKCKE